MRYHDEGARGVAQPVDALGDDPQGVDVQPGVGLVEDRQARGEQRHLQYLRALLLAAGKADVDRALQHLEIDLEALRRSAGRAHEVGGREIALPVRAPSRIECGLEECHRRDAGNFTGYWK